MKQEAPTSLGGSSSQSSSNDYLVLVYFAESLLIAIVLALVAYIHVCENGKKESDCAKNDENIC